MRTMNRPSTISLTTQALLFIQSLTFGRKAWALAPKATISKDGSASRTRVASTNGKPFGLALSGPGQPISGGIFAACVAVTCGVAAVVCVLGRRTEMWLIRRRRAMVADYLADPRQG